MMQRTATPRFGGTFIVTGPDKEAVAQRILAEDAKSTLALGALPGPWRQDQFRGRLVTDDENGQDATQLLKMMEYPFPISADRAENEANLETFFTQLPDEFALNNAVSSYAAIRDSVGKAQHIDLIA